LFVICVSCKVFQRKRFAIRSQWSIKLIRPGQGR